MRRAAAITLVGLLAATGCSEGSAAPGPVSERSTGSVVAGEPDASSSGSSPATTRGSASAPSDGGAAVSESAGTRDERLDTAGGGSSAPLTVAVDTQPLPADVEAAIRAGGGELASTVEWVSRFAPPDLPVLTGDGVHLVEADFDATRITNGWQRVDALQWLFTDAAAVGVAGFLDRLAATVAIDGWSRVDDSSIVDAAQCVTRTYTDATVTSTWVLQGCEYPKFAGMVAVGITRTAAFDISVSPAVIEPSAIHVVDDVAGRIDRVSAVFGPPSAPESTSTLVTSIDITIDEAGGDAAAVLSHNALAGWTVEQAEAGSVVFTGSPGHAWTLFGDTVRFTSEGRLSP